jgi:hypothetical protein
MVKSKYNSILKKGGTVATKEHKVGELLANSVEDHFFNPATLAYYLSQQPTWTIDRVMEVVAWIIEKNARRAEVEAGNGIQSEGLILAYNLDKLVDRMKSAKQFEHIKLP